MVDAHVATTGDDYRTAVALFKKSKKARQAELDEMRNQIRDLTSQLAALTSSQAASSGQIDELVTRLGSLDARITQVGTEVTHQLGELSGDIDSLAQRTTAMGDEISHLGDVPTIVDEVRTDQARLANEQARYEIAFRQDLAELAERLQRQRPNG
jgi:chromosome segregation ATPase